MAYLYRAIYRKEIMLMTPINSVYELRAMQPGVLLDVSRI